MVWWDLCDTEGRYRLQAILVLTFSDAKNSDLGNNIPNCYENNGWAKGYKDGQREAKNRKYPVMRFDGNAQNQLVWLKRRHFRQLNIQDEHLEHRQDVQNYLASHSNVTLGRLQ